MQERVLSNPKIKIIYNTIITKLIGNEYMKKLNVKIIENNIIFKLQVDGFFYGLGLTPNTKLFNNQIRWMKMDIFKIS